MVLSFSFRTLFIFLIFLSETKLLGALFIGYLATLSDQRLYIIDGWMINKLGAVGRIKIFKLYLSPSLGAPGMGNQSGRSFRGGQSSANLKTKADSVSEESRFCIL
jgi:hypothetical protein